MKTLSTTTCQDQGQREIVIEYDPAVVIEADVEQLLFGLEAMVAGGTRFEPGQSMAFGWSLAWLVDRPDGRLGFEEPDFRSLPAERVPGLTATIRDLRLQRDIVASVLPDDALEFASLEQSCIVCDEVGATGGFVMERAEPEETANLTIDCRGRPVQQPGNRTKARAPFRLDHDRGVPFSAQVFVLPFQSNLRLGREYCTWWLSQTGVRAICH